MPSRIGIKIGKVHNKQVYRQSRSSGDFFYLSITLFTKADINQKALEDLIPPPNPIESTFAIVRHRTKRSKGCLSRETALIMVFKLIKTVEKTWRRLDGKNQLPKVITGVKFCDRCEVIADDERAAA